MHSTSNILERNISYNLFCRIYQYCSALNPLILLKPLFSSIMIKFIYMYTILFFNKKMYGKDFLLNSDLLDENGDFKKVKIFNIKPNCPLLHTTGA